MNMSLKSSGRGMYVFDLKSAHASWARNVTKAKYKVKLELGGGNGILAFMSKGAAQQLKADLNRMFPD
jgi:hypothetical protein